jgi:ornithine carbamoyltransferase
MTSSASPLNAMGLLQAAHTATSTLQGRKMGYIGDGRHPLVLDLIRASQMLQFGLTVSSPKRFLPVRTTVDPILDREYKSPSGEVLPAAVFEAVEHPFIAAAQTDFIVTDTVVPHLTPQAKPSHPLTPTLGQYEVDREMLSVAKDTVRMGHVTNVYPWAAPPLGADDPRCLWATQLVEENYAAVALCAWALRKTVL